MSTADRTAPAQEAVFAPGQRVEIRDAEWVIKHPDRTSSGHYSLLVTGVSPLVQGRERRFLTEIDTDIRPLHPEDTKLVADASPKFADTRLYLESLLRQSPPTGSDLWIGHNAAIDVMDYQLDPCVLPKPRLSVAAACPADRKRLLHVRADQPGDEFAHVWFAMDAPRSENTRGYGPAAGMSPACDFKRKAQI